MCGTNGRWNTDPTGLVCTGEIFVHYDYKYTLLNNVNGWGRNLMLTYFCNDVTLFTVTVPESFSLVPSAIHYF